MQFKASKKTFVTDLRVRCDLHPLVFCWLVLGLSLMSACTKSTLCLTPKVVALRGGFYWQDTAAVFKDSLLTNANLIFGKSFSYQLNVRQSSKFAFSLAQDTGVVKVFFQSDSTSSDPQTIDTLLLHYDRQPHFISTACGYETFFSINRIEYSQQVIDTVILSNANVNNDVNKEHIKIVIRK